MSLDEKLRFATEKNLITVRLPLKRHNKIFFTLFGFFIGMETIVIYLYPYLQDMNNQFKALFWSCIFGGISSLVASLCVEEINLNLPWTDWILIICHSTSFVLLTPPFVIASAYVPSLVNIIGSTTTIWVVLAQYTVLSSIHPGNRNLMEIIGVVLMILCSVIPSIVKTRKQKNKSELPE